MYDFRYDGVDASVLLDVRGAQRTQSLFWEMSDPASRKKYPPLYVLSRHSKHGLPSAYEIFMNSVDETEAALRMVGSLTHWRKLTSLKWFREGDGLMFEGVDQWRLDMQARDNSLAKSVILQQVKEGDLQAAKKLYDETKTPKAKRTKKASTPDAVSEEDTKITSLHKRISKK